MAGLAVMPARFKNTLNSITMAIKLEDQINAVSNFLDISKKDVENSITLDEEQINEASVDFWRSLLDSLNNYKQLKESVKSLSWLATIPDRGRDRSMNWIPFLLGFLDKVNKR